MGGGVWVSGFPGLVPFPEGGIKIFNRECAVLHYGNARNFNDSQNIPGIRD